MRKTKVIKQLLNKIDILEIKNKDLEEKNEILQFIVDVGKFPVQFINTGAVQIPFFQNSDRIIRKELYSVKYIDTNGDIKTISLEFLQDPEFKIVKNNVKECVFTVEEYKENPLWFKLYKDKKIVVEIPKPYEYSNNGNISQ